MKAQAVIAAIGLLWMGTPLLGAAPPATPAPEPTAKHELKEIGRVRARTPFCAAFETHFNAAAHAMIEQDGSIGAIDFTLGDIKSTYNEMGGDLRRSDDRRKLAAYVDQMNHDIPIAEAELNALKAASALTSNAEQAAQNRELVKQLEKGLERQKAIAIDTAGVVRALMEVDSGVKSADSDHLPGSYDPYTNNEPKNGQDVRHYLHYQDQRDRIGDAESNAAGIADAIVTSC